MHDAVGGGGGRVCMLSNEMVTVNQPVMIKGFDVNMHGVHLKIELSNCNQDKIQDSKICNSCKGLPSDWCMF
jgi:hypothetical protein